MTSLLKNRQIINVPLRQYFSDPSARLLAVAEGIHIMPARKDHRIYAGQLRRDRRRFGQSVYERRIAHYDDGRETGSPVDGNARA